MPSLPMRVPAATPRYFFFLSSAGEISRSVPNSWAASSLCG